MNTQITYLGNHLNRTFATDSVLQCENDVARSACETEQTRGQKAHTDNQKLPR